MVDQGGCDIRKEFFSCLFYLGIRNNFNRGIYLVILTPHWNLVAWCFCGSKIKSVSCKLSFVLLLTSNANISIDIQMNY